MIVDGSMIVSNASIAGKLLRDREIPLDMCSVRDYNCSDSCGPGPRFIVSATGYVPVCYDMYSFKRVFESYPNLRGTELVNAIMYGADGQSTT